MPVHTKVIKIEITVEQFLNNCSRLELQELSMLLQSEKYQREINPTLKQLKPNGTKH
jgi:hypothetical protein